MNEGCFFLQKSDGQMIDVQMVFLLDWADLVYVYLHWPPREEILINFLVYILIVNQPLPFVVDVIVCTIFNEKSN